MRLISRNTDYAIRALVFLAREKEKIVPVPELVKELNMPRPFLRKILQCLNKEGLLASYKGKGGGFRLARKPERIFLSDVMKVFQGDIMLNECLFKKSVCPNRRTCPLKKKIDMLEKHVASELRSISIKSLMRG